MHTDPVPLWLTLHTFSLLVLVAYGTSVADGSYRITGRILGRKKREREQRFPSVAPMFKRVT